MSRQRKCSVNDARRKWRALAKGIGARPTVRMFAQEINVSVRTAWRYLSLIQDGAVLCPRCHGRGWTK